MRALKVVAYLALVAFVVFLNIAWYTWLRS